MSPKIFCIAIVLIATDLHLVASNKSFFLKKFNQDKIIPDLIDQFPQEKIEVKYDSGVEMNLGNELTPTKVKNIPTSLTWTNSKDKSLYTLLLVDLDAPSRKDPISRSFLHWMVVNVAGNNLQSGETIVEYIGSGPPSETGLHRYVMLVFKQKKSITPSEPKITNRQLAGRPNFNVREFAKKYDLGGVFAANYYQAQYDDYVPILHKQLSK